MTFICRNKTNVRHLLVLHVELGFNLLRPGVHMYGHHVLGCVTTVLNSAQIGHCDYNVKKKYQTGARLLRG